MPYVVFNYQKAEFHQYEIDNFWGLIRSVKFKHNNSNYNFIGTYANLLFFIDGTLVHEFTEEELKDLNFKYDTIKDRRELLIPFFLGFAIVNAQKRYQAKDWFNKKKELLRIVDDVCFWIN